MEPEEDTQEHHNCNFHLENVDATGRKFRMHDVDEKDYKMLAGNSELKIFIANIRLYMFVYFICVCVCVCEVKCEV
jgi:hypothetical protein